MLKALELVGFKSFADKTRFEFPPGITVVVGPNGSGKSNVVDAIKWVLGEQSAKSLRGKEMADVIFNGSGSRPGLNSAETTLTFENSNRLLPIESPEVHITRRVYRSGEGEYLINRQPCRLRDIRELFSGTGVATEAYSVIEQGKVDVLLQSSPRDRRVIFEEAAGISRFKMKKIESLRRLERVDQNLLRLADIVQEIDNQLKNVRKQASKAQRYKQLTDRLQELRTQVGLADWRRLGEGLAQLETELARLRDEASSTAAKAESFEAQALALDTELGDLNEAIRACEARNAENRERIAANESTIAHERQRAAEFEEEVDRHRRQLAAMNVRAGDVDQRLFETREAVQAAESQHREVCQQLADGERTLTDLTRQADELRDTVDRNRAAYVETVRLAASLNSEIRSLESQRTQLDDAAARCAGQLAEMDQNLAELTARHTELVAEQEQLAQRAASDQQARAETEAALEQLRQQQTALQETLGGLKQRHSGASERAALLAEWEQRLEGLSAGVKEILVRAKAATAGPFRQVRGLVADLIQVELESAPLVEVALGECAQHVVVEGSQFFDFLEQNTHGFSGRVGFISLETAAADEPAAVDLGNQPGVLGRADQLVSAPTEVMPLVQRLLGHTWVVESLTVARKLAASHGKGGSFVTRAGELLTADQTLTVGPRHTGTGLISRRSELRALREQISALEQQIAAAATELAALATELRHQESVLSQQAVACRAAQEAVAEHRLKVHAVQSGKAQWEQRRGAAAAEQIALISQISAANARHEQASGERKELEQVLERQQQQIAEIERQCEQVDDQRARSGRQLTDVKVDLAKSEERLESLRAQLRQFERDQQERTRALSETQTQLATCEARASQSRFSILEAESRVADLYLRKEGFTAETVALISKREALRNDRSSLVEASQQARSHLRQVEEQIHAQDLAASEIRLQRDALAGRLRDDYGIELAELEHEPSAEELRQRHEVDEEIAELRRKITNLGSVNVEALQELDELEKRHDTLAAQHEDLSNAKRALEQIITKINTDSRRLFAETLELVRGHFQDLFRKLFGGGQADIVLEEGVDILDSGIEIVARPPGKEPRSISLLSGGEKTLTCVALLLAIFHSRPSPFCVLDEVDAALDEANIERFIGVLKEFLAWTQFVIVTHSKKTMTCANTLHGVTMQESGVSKRVSVRFEDVSDNGEIRLPPNRRGLGDDNALDQDDTQAA